MAGLSSEEVGLLRPVSVEVEVLYTPYPTQRQRLIFDELASVVLSEANSEDSRYTVCEM